MVNDQRFSVTDWVSVVQSLMNESGLIPEELVLDFLACGGLQTAIPDLRSAVSGVLSRISHMARVSISSPHELPAQFSRQGIEGNKPLAPGDYLVVCEVPAWGDVAGNWSLADRRLSDAPQADSGMQIALALHQNQTWIPEGFRHISYRWLFTQARISVGDRDCCVAGLWSADHRWELAIHNRRTKLWKERAFIVRAYRLPVKRID